ncbi:hypothetical protein [Cellulophaga sp. L1A9]|uniref:hypothetical protein n=1 Tax=Cellulophaga sp. L1A9 TaxID=2686362 RepID=UPI00131DE734|nr:hypothetical protein [Cellulophaga sp. L1A9]
MEKILVNIKKKHPKATLTFQNIEVKIRTKSPSQDKFFESEFDTMYFYIKNNQFEKESDFSLNFYLLPVLFFSVIFINPKNLKIRELHKKIHPALIIISGITILYILIIINPFEKNKYSYASLFKHQTTLLLNEMSLDRYKK